MENNFCEDLFVKNDKIYLIIWKATEIRISFVTPTYHGAAIEMVNSSKKRDPLACMQF